MSPTCKSLCSVCRCFDIVFNKFFTPIAIILWVSTSLANFADTLMNSLIIFWNSFSSLKNGNINLIKWTVVALLTLNIFRAFTSQIMSFGCNFRIKNSEHVNIIKINSTIRQVVRHFNALYFNMCYSSIIDSVSLATHII